MNKQFFYVTCSTGLSIQEEDDRRSRGYGVLHRYSSDYISGENPAGSEEVTYCAVCGFETVDWSMGNMGRLNFTNDDDPFGIPPCKACFPDKS